MDGQWKKANDLPLFTFLPYMWEIWEKYRGWKMLRDRQALTSEKRFLSPERGLKPQLSDDRWGALTIELP